MVDQAPPPGDDIMINLIRIKTTQLFTHAVDGGAQGHGDGLNGLTGLVDPGLVRFVSFNTHSSITAFKKYSGDGLSAGTPINLDWNLKFQGEPADSLRCG